MRRQTFAALALVPALGLGLQACGGDGKGTAATGTAKAVSDQQKMRQYAQCMRANGVDMDDPSGDGKVTTRMSKKPGAKGKDGPDEGPGGMDDAQKKCRHLMPNGGKPPKPKPEEIAKQRAYSKCMRDNGIAAFPDPDPDGGIKIKMDRGSDMDPQGQKFKNADKACKKYAPDRGPGGAGAGKSGIDS
ncbi:hypothetical protein [Actinomadura rubrisoli]|uniref:Uncharacterized protein n=1 Tax=Actinomadura rubrisoli TaxID=2530368 RepID=A0A4R5C7M0_9ACTN|nr:hypothetical protein [Actinomadura rubrisoli]TDD93034.1 hypothetical protein E1298_10165 [Actinomadura rubrisoli]